MFAVYRAESLKNASSALARLRRSLFMDVKYAFVFEFPNFGIAIAASIPMMTMTISSSMSVKPFRFMTLSFESGGLPVGQLAGRRKARQVSENLAGRPSEGSKTSGRGCDSPPGVDPAVAVHR